MRNLRRSSKRATSWALVAALASVACGTDYAPFREHQISVARSAAELVATDALFGRIEALCAARLADPERDASYGDACHDGEACVYSRSAAAGLLRQWWRESRLAATTELKEQVVSEGGFTTTNLWVDLPGTKRPDEWVLATAHYDAWFCAANDNASGVAVVFEAAVALSQLPVDRSVRFLWVDGEEQGMVGTGRYLADNAVDGVVMVVNADMVAFVGDRSSPLTGEPSSIDYWVQANEDSAGAAYRAADLGRHLPQPIHAKAVVYPGNGVSAAGVVFGYSQSDHAPFWLEGVRAIYPLPVGDLPASYHTPRDTPEKLDRGLLSRAGRFWAGMLAAFATVSK